MKCVKVNKKIKNMKKIKLGIIGAGNMASAIVSGILHEKLLTSKQIVVFDVDTKKLKAFAKKYSVQTAQTLAHAAAQATHLLLAVKPQNFSEVLPQISLCLDPKAVVISIAAGIDLAFIESKLGKTKKIVRCMPNMPAMVGWGATSFVGNSYCKEADKKVVTSLFASVGMVIELDHEKDLDAVTALSGSGPAFAYQFVHELSEAGKKIGLSTKLSELLALQTVHGALEMLHHTGLNPAELIAQVTSKGGTTLAGLDALKKNGFSKSINECLKAAKKRAVELREMAKKS